MLIRFSTNAMIHIPIPDNKLFKKKGKKGVKSFFDFAWILNELKKGVKSFFDFAWILNELIITINKGQRKI
jgi:hypothetical protein